ncbi:hypothetical protein [Methylocystis sp.]|uniref:hypothetical protein n=1 Tax=Methylocystis sp. TaxID=1911079 RepID=UPI0025DE97BF|nr:hypothetical protein [Methylocystis sp.]
MNRLEKLEHAHGVSGSSIQLIERMIVDPRQGQLNPEGYVDKAGNRWTRELGEQFKDFHERVTAEAIAHAHPRIAVIVGNDRVEVSSI